MVQTARIVMMKKNTAMTRKDCLQLAYFVAKPEDILPRMNPRGLLAPRAPVTLFLLRPSGYIAKSVPIAGGEITAVPKPRKPQRTLMESAFGAKAVRREKRARDAKPARSWNLRPKRSAILPKKSMNEP